MMTDDRFIEADQGLTSILAHVERGETVTITRDGRPIGVVHPVSSFQTSSLLSSEQAANRLRGLRSGLAIPFSADDIVDLVHESRPDRP